MSIPSFIKRKWYILLAPAALLVGAAVYPFESAVVPNWGVRVVDVEGKACAAMPVYQLWGHYSLFWGGDPGNDRAVTDDQGFAAFPERKIRASLVRRIIFPPIAEALTLAHGSSGLRANVSTHGMTDDNLPDYQPGQPLPDLIQVEKCLTEADLREK